MSGPFGNTSGGGFAFGQTPVTTQTPSLFGTNPATSGPVTGFAFGSAATFGKPAQTTQSTFSFANPSQSTSTYGFGGQPTQQTFASPPAQTTAFSGQQTTPFATGLNFGGGSVFSTTPATPATVTPVLGFGTPTSFAGFPVSTPAFGSPAPVAASTGGGFIFGGPAATTTAAPTATAAGLSFGGIGGSAANQLTGSSLFKTGSASSMMSTPQSETSIFGVPNVTAPATTSTFGSMTPQGTTGFKATPTSGFGATNPASTLSFGGLTQPSFGAPGQSFGNVAATSQPGLGGVAATSQAATFGTPVMNNTTSFGASPAQPVATGSIFGQNLIASEGTATGTPIFGQNLVVRAVPTPPTTTTSAFGQSSTAPAPSYQFGPPITSVSAPAAGLSLSASGFAGLGGGIKLGGAVTTSAPITSAAVGGGIAVAAPVSTAVVTTTAPITGFGAISFPTLPKTTTTSTTSDTTPTMASGIGSTTSTMSSAPTIGFSLTGSSSSGVGATTASVTGLATSAPISATTTVASTVTSASGMNFRQLEETINKWTMELEEQEKIYLNQATQVNAWDRMLIKNGEKITHLNDSLERVKLDQQHLEHEIDFILAQQKELEDLLVPLEQQVDQTPTLSVQQHADLEREHTYELAENIDSQMKRMAEDLKEIIDHVNASNNNQDNTDPVYQVGKILNAHMDSLQWIEQNTNLVQRKLEEVSQLYEVRRKDQERRFRLAYE